MDILKKLLTKEILGPIIVILVSIILIKIIKRILIRIFTKSEKLNNKKNKTILSLITNIFRFFIWAVALIIILGIFGVNTMSLIASLGVVGIVIGLAVQDILKDLIAGISIIFDNEYAIGDIVEISGFKGEVVELGLRVTKIKAYTGEVKMLSNRNITEIINYSVNDNLAIVDISVAYESDIEKVQKVLDDLSIDLKEKYNLTSIQCIGIQDLADSAIVFRITAISSKKDKYELARIIRKEVVLYLNKNKINIPYNQLVIHNAK